VKRSQAKEDKRDEFRRQDRNMLIADVEEH
jgi:hypothetical protein